MADIPEGRLIVFWIIGALAILFGTWIAGHVETALGVTTGSYALALLVAFLLILFGGLAWIAVAVTVSQEEEVSMEQIRKQTRS